MPNSTPRREVQEDEDSFSSLSSPMSSPPASPSAQLSNENSYAQEISKASTSSHDFAARSVTAQANNTQPQEAPARKKPGRKPKPVDPNDPVAVKKAQRNAQRTAKRQSAKEAERANNPPPPPAAAPVAVVAQPRRKKTSTANLNNNNDVGGSSKVIGNGGAQQKITDMGIRPTEFKVDVPILKSNVVAVDVPAAQNGKNEDIPTPSNTYSNQPTPRPLIHRSPSGQNYDPIRSNFDPVRETVITQTPSFPNSQTSPIPPHTINRASASPSISSLVDPPNHIPQSPSHQSFFNQQARLQHHETQSSLPTSPTHARLAPSPMIPPTIKNPVPPPAAMHVQPIESSSVFGAPATKKQVPIASASTASSSTTHSPKPVKGKDPLPPPLPGSLGGLLQNGMLGGIGGPAGEGTEFRAPTIILHIPMNGDTNKCINFFKLAEDQYGWDALHPRLAAQRDRLARVAAAGAALEKSGAGQRESGDEMSLDLSEGEGSNAEMGGMSDGRTGTDGGKKPIKKRKNKEDEYDKDDGFVDDSDMLWEAQAAASKDGFFVYSGPLVPEVEKPVLDRYVVLDPKSKFRLTNDYSGQDGSNKRGRGRGRGGTTRATTGARGATATAAAPVIPTAAAVAAAAAAANTSAARGSGITRKPRITKAAREQMILEKQERERMGMHASTFAPNITQLPSSRAEVHGGTQMVFSS